MKTEIQDPILNIATREDATDMLCGQRRLSGRQRRHLMRVRERVVSVERKDPQFHADYWAKKLAGSSAHRRKRYLRKWTRGVVSGLYRLDELAPSSRFRERIERQVREYQSLIQLLNQLEEQRHENFVQPGV